MMFEEKKKTEVKSDKPKKNEATVNGRNLAVGLKHATAICNMIRGKNIDVTILETEYVNQHGELVSKSRSTLMEI